MQKQKEIVEYEEKKAEMPIAKNLEELYMLAQSKLIYAKSSEERYVALMNTINTGKVLLPDDKKDLKKRAESILEDSKNYMANSNIKLETDKNTYHLGSEGIGIIQVRAEEINDGRAEVISQQCEKLIPILKVIDNEILDALTEANVIQKKNPMKALMDNLRNDMMKLIQEEEEKAEKKVTKSGK